MCGRLHTVQGLGGDPAEGCAGRPDFPNLLWCKQKWLCRNTSCVRKQFTESVPQIPPRARFTVRAKAEMAAAVLDGWRSVAEVSAAYGTTWNTCHAAVVAMADPVLALALAPIRVLGIDETRRGKAKWETDPATGIRTWVDRFDSGMVDIAGDQGLLAQVNGREVATVVAWINSQTPEFRAGITHVAIDMSATYAKAVRKALPHARIVVDHFHVVKLANQMIDDVRRRTTQALRGRRGRACDPEWTSRRRLLRGMERLTEEQRQKTFQKLDTFDPDGDLVAAWITKELLRKVMACKYRGGRRDQIAAAGGVLHIRRRRQGPRDPHPGHHHRHLAAADHRRDRHRPVQRPQRRLQPDRQTHRTDRFRVSQQRQPTPPDTMGMHPPNQARAIQGYSATPLLILKSPLCREGRWQAV
jgi:hypothetical protein